MMNIFRISIPRRPIMAALRLATLTLAVLALSACEDPLGTLLGLQSPPANVKATRGDHADRIVVTWDDASARESNGDSPEVTGYRIQRQSAGSTGWDSRGDVSDTSYTDNDVQPGESYEYRVRTNLSGGSPPYSSWSDPVTGYALDARDLRIYAENRRHLGAVSYNAWLDDEWFSFEGQRGWTYRVEDPTGTDVDLFRRGNIEDPLTNDDVSSDGAARLYRLPRTATYHVRLRGGSSAGANGALFSVSHR